jgi:hypothetical protein
VRTFRLLLWLRWRLGMNASTRRGRWVAVLVIGMLVLALAPLYLGGAIAAMSGARAYGATSLLVTFGTVQLIILWLSLLTGAMGRLFELDKLKRYPLRPTAVFLVNMVAGLTEPIVLMCLPALIGAVIGVGLHDGGLAASAAALGVVVLLMTTMAWVQLLLAVLDDLLRREWMRYVAGFGLSLTILAFQMFVSQTGGRLSENMRSAGFDPEHLLVLARHVFSAVPTVAAAASVAGSRPEGLFANGGLGLLGSLLLIALPVALGVRIMARAAQRPAALTPVRTRRSGERGLSLPIPASRARRACCSVASSCISRARPRCSSRWRSCPSRSSGSRCCAHDEHERPGVPADVHPRERTRGSQSHALEPRRPGVRTLFLMPVGARDLVLTKNLAWLASAFVEATVVFTALSFTRGEAFRSQLPTYLTGYLALAFTAGVIGTVLSIRRPTKPPAQGMGRRNADTVGGLLGLLAILLTLGVVVLLIVAARALTPPAWHLAASTVVTSTLMLMAMGLWWIAQDRCATMLDANRERMIDVLAKSADA